MQFGLRIIIANEITIACREKSSVFRYRWALRSIHADEKNCKARAELSVTNNRKERPELGVPLSLGLKENVYTLMRTTARPYGLLPLMRTIARRTSNRCSDALGVPLSLGLKGYVYTLMRTTARREQSSALRSITVDENNRKARPEHGAALQWPSQRFGVPGSTKPVRTVISTLVYHILCSHYSADNIAGRDTELGVPVQFDCSAVAVMFNILPLISAHFANFWHRVTSEDRRRSVRLNNECSNTIDNRMPVEEALTAETSISLRLKLALIEAA
ncbi:hypothetical protein J6590_030289 [Homalodisca vitripennis]|nr:hypothetical protein J6590_030289 [Homalodisca vitripennis]